ncbi:Uncharacterised protein [Pasteurella multocida]|uniref:FabA-like domain protein n=1 Tax=Pasteurella dagmatis ATCC 43325 TaxID=667128 RepID=C9PNS9_9PAST|nr:hypothetical protein [Pasteurella dagmatis]EEX50720.1 hypothetical protein HMPREF0621_0661 [Pasteurella dagmatis ATCC 43325]SNV77892.1 Uncharacterised protein [Pasteurella dagmatis]VEI58477.1 Uncharacterised protein [Pasteurella multocida]
MYNLASHQASEYLLHNAPMLLVDEILQVSDTHIEVKIEIDEKHQLFFNQAQQVPVWVSIELMAQAVGTWAGVQSKIKDNSQAQIGFLLGARQCKHFVSHYQMHEILRVYAHLLIQDQRMASFDVKIINSQNQVTAEGRLTTYQPDQNELGQLLNKE